MRNLKKISAIFLVIAMLFSLVTVNVFADGEDVTIDLEVSKTSVGQGKSFDLTVYYTYNSGESILATTHGFKLSYNVDATIEDLSTSDMLYDKAGANASTINEAKRNIVINGLNGNVTATRTAVAKFKFTVAETASTSTPVQFTLSNFGYTTQAGALTTKVNTTPTVQVKKAFTVQSYTAPAVQSANLGDKVSDIVAKLNALEIEVKGDPADTEAVGTLKATDWACDELANVETVETSKEYTFKGNLVGNDTITVPDAKKQVEVKVNVGKIDLATDTAVTTDAPSEKDYMLSKNAGEVKAGTAIASELPATVKIKKGDKYEEEATVAWAPKAGSKAELDLTKLTSEDKTNIVTLVGTITPSATNTNYTGTKTVECVAKVVPAEITGSKFSVDNAAQYGNAKVAFTIPGAEVNGKKVSAYMYTKLTTDGKIDETSLVANSKVETEEITAEVSSEGGATPVTYKDYTGSLQFASFDSLGLKTNDKFYVVLKVDTATVKNGEDMYVESYVLPESNRRPNNGGGNSGGTVVVKKHDVKVTEGTNGTATVDKEAKVGDTVKVDVKPNEGYKVKEIIVKTADGKTVEVDQKNRTFVMPDGDVTVEVVYEEGTEEPTVADGKFTDVPDTFWAAADIYTLKEAGIINGKSDKEFDPEGKVTRAEFTKMIVNLFGVKASQNTVAFTDCKADDWFTPFVAAAVEAGYVKGITDTEFAPDKTITREEACTILGRAYAKTSDKALNFTDASGISDFATAYVALLVDMGYVNGYEDGTFLPKNEITRAEAAKIIASAFRAAEKAKTEVTEDKTEAKDNADADVKADDKTDAKADDKTEVKADDKTDAKADAKTDAKADNGETPEK